MGSKLNIKTTNGKILGTLDPGFGSYYFFHESDSRVEEEEALYEVPLVFGDTKPLFDFLAYSQADIAEVMEVDPSTLFRWKKEDKKLTKLLTKALKDMDKIIAKGIRIFGSEARFSDWLHTSNFALGDQKPADLMKNPYGMEKVDEALEAISWGNIL